MFSSGFQPTGFVLEAGYRKPLRPVQDSQNPVHLRKRSLRQACLYFDAIYPKFPGVTYLHSGHTVRRTASLHHQWGRLVQASFQQWTPQCQGTISPAIFVQVIRRNKIVSIAFQHTSQSPQSYFGRHLVGSLTSLPPTKLPSGHSLALSFGAGPFSVRASLLCVRM